jgi:hypothetical protein
MGLYFKMPFQSQEEGEWEEGERKVLVWRYLPESWDAQRDSEPVRSFQPSFEMKARFTSLIFLIPKPPKALGVQIEFQDLRDKFLVFVGGKPHQKFLKTLSSWLQILWGSRKVLMA